MDPVEEKKVGEETETAEPTEEQTTETSAVTDGTQAETETDETDSTDKPAEVEKPLFDEKQQKVFDERLGKEVGKRKALEEQVEDLKGQAAAGAAEAVRAVGVHPSYLGSGEREQIQRVGTLEAEETRLEAEADSEDAEVRSKAKGELVKVRQELRRLAPGADAAYDRAVKQQVADTLLGRQVRLEREKAAKQTAEAARNKPKKPAGGTDVAATASARPIASGTPKRGVNVDRFKKAGADADAAARELAGL